jgi:hypothetical protein
MSELATFDPLVNSDLRLVADNPTDMQQAQSQLKDWTAHKIMLLNADLAVHKQNEEEAIGAGLRPDNFKRAVTLTEKQINYYNKIREALRLGYYIVPNFPIDVFAIRTKAKKPKRGDTTHFWSNHQQYAQKLPLGEGRFVDSYPEQHQYHDEQTNSKTGETKTVKKYYAHHFMDVQFPIALVRPEVVRSTTRAMKGKVFDQIGVIPERRAKADPMIIGQILDPRSNDKMVSFLITWWLDTKTL